MTYQSNLSLEHLSLDIILRISSFLSTPEILNLSEGSKHLHDILFAIRFPDEISLSEIRSLPYIDSFTNVVCSKVKSRFPKFLQQLYWNSNEPIQFKLPDTITHLYFQDDYNLALPQLPLSLIHLDTGIVFNQPLAQLPEKLQHLVLGRCYSYPLPTLPASLVYLKLGTTSNCIIGQLPDNLTHLILVGRYKYPLPELPASLSHLKLGIRYNHPLPKLPDTLSYLIMSRDYNLPLSLPCKLKSLALGPDYNQSLSLPDELADLRLGRNYNQPFTKLPASLLRLVLGYYYSQLLPQLPDDLIHLDLGHWYDHPISQLPASLSTLKLGFWYCRYLPPLPYSLTHLEFKGSYHHYQHFPSLPESLRKLVVPESCPLPANLSTDLVVELIKN